MGYEKLSERLPSYSVYSFNFIESDNRLREYADRITEVDPEGPYALLGWSAGGKLAFQVAKSLENRRKRVAGIVMMDSARYVKKISAVEERTEKDVADFVKSITSRVIREKTARKMRNYRLYIANFVEHDVVNADIHLVTEENAEDDFHDEKGNIIANRRGWRDLTHGAFRTYQGYGKHTDMMDSHHAAPNSKLIRDILDRIVAKDSR
jgi:thioesterase domain-containing protein